MPQFVFTPDNELTAIAIGYQNPRENFIADKIFPYVAVATPSFSYNRYPLAEGFSVPNTKVGRTSKPNTVEFSAVRVTAEVELPAGTILNRASDGLIYKTISDMKLQPGQNTVGIKCAEEGSIGNCGSGVVLTFAKIVIAVESQAIVESVGAGADDESDQDLLARYLQYIRSVYHGGADSDYRKWALEVEGVNRAWVYPHEMGAGTVSIRIMTPSGFPDEILLEKVKAHIDSKRPVTVVRVLVLPPVARAINYSISNLSPNSDIIKASIVSALQKGLNETAVPEGVLLLAEQHKAILSVSGLYNYHLNDPTQDIALGIGEVAVMGEIIWL